MTHVYVRWYIVIIMVICSIISYKNDDNSSSSINESETPEKAFNTFIDNSYSIIRGMIQDAVDHIDFYDSSCKKIIENTYLNDLMTRYFIGKLIYKSSRHINDLSTYNTCIRKRYINDKYADFKYSFAIVEWRKYSNDYIVESHMSSNTNTFSSTYYYSYSVFGLCIVSGCNIKDVREIIHYINTNKGLLQYNMKKEDIKISIITANNDTYTSYSALWRLFPLIILIIHIIISSFTGVFCCLRRCFKSNTSYKKFINCFLFAENTEILLNYKTMSSKLNNESGLNYILGIRGLLLFFIILGSFFQVANISPSHLDEINAFEEIMKSFFFSLIFFGLRIAPRILLSCSGYILVFKLMCFLDNKKEGNDLMNVAPIFPIKSMPGLCNDSDRDDDDSNSNSDDDKMEHFDYSVESSTISNLTCGLGNSNCTISNVDDINNQKNKVNNKEKASIASKAHEKYNDNNNNIDNTPSIILLFKFLFYQIHIYFITAIAFISMIYSIGSTYSFFTKINPTWIYFHNTIIKDSSFSSFCKYMIFFQQFLIQFGYNASDTSDNYSGINNQELGNIFKYEWILFNEMIFFILTSILIYVCYRKRYPLAKILLVLIVILIIVKYAIFYYYRFWKVLMYSTRFYQIHSYGLFFTNPLYNYSFYLLGVFFGLINYTIQKGMCSNSYNNHHRKLYKKHLSFPITIGMFLEDKGVVFIYMNGVIGLVLVVLGSMSQFIFINSIKNGSLSTYIKDSNINFFYMIDIEIIVLICHWCTIAFAIKGDNFVNKFLSQEIWNVPNKFYCSFILLINPIILILLYGSETRISLTMPDILFYSMISTIITIFVACLFYCLFESPYKRLVHLLINYNNKEKEEKERERQESLDMMKYN